MDPDNEIKIDNIVYDVYFILGVTSEDSIEHITKEFKKKAKLLHPDKLSIEDRKDPKKVLKKTKQFKVLTECFEFISNKKQSFNYSRQNKHSQIEIINNTDLNQKQFDNSNDLKFFNDEFSRLKVETPNDFGYDFERIPALDERNYEKLANEYNSDTFKPTKLFTGKKFDPKDFNKTFEYHQSQFEEPETALIHKTTDGFNGYNSGFLSGANELGCASVSSFNGVMIVGDNFGESGVGYNDSNFSDYRQSFKKPKNPNSKLNVPSDFKQKITKDTPLSQTQIDEQLRLRKNIEIKSKEECYFTEQEKVLLQSQINEQKNKSQQDKEFILKYQNMFDSQTIQDAMNKKLVTSDFVPEMQRQFENLQQHPQQHFPQDFPQQHHPQDFPQHFPQDFPQQHHQDFPQDFPQQHHPQDFPQDFPQHFSQQDFPQQQHFSQHFSQDFPQHFQQHPRQPHNQHFQQHPQQINSLPPLQLSPQLPQNTRQPHNQFNTDFYQKKF
jgi:curved DNA-binding protein CbpA